MTVSIKNSIAILDRNHRKWVRRLVLVRIFWLGLLMALVLFAADLLFAFGDSFRLCLDGTAILLALGAALYTHQSERRSSSISRMIARAVEKEDPTDQNVLVNAVDFEELLTQEPRPGVSTNLMAEEITIAEDYLCDLPDFSSLRPKTFQVEKKLLFGMLALSGVLFVLAANLFGVIVPRFLFPFGNYPPYSSTRFEVQPPGARIDFGDNLKVTIRTSGTIPDDVSLVTHDEEGKEIAEHPMFQDEEGVFFTTLENVRQDLEYFARIHRGRSKRYPLSVAKTPKISEVQVTYTYPEYTRLKPETHLLTENLITGYRNTNVRLTLSSNRPLSGGTLTVCGQVHELNPADTYKVEGSFVLSESGEYSATLQFGEFVLHHFLLL